MAVLFNAGDQTPIIPLSEVMGSGANVVPEHIASICVKNGMTSVPTTTVSVVVVAHCPTKGVKVYVVVEEVFKTGLHTPTIPLMDVVGSGEVTVPEQIGATGLNVGVIAKFTTIVSVVIVAHCPAFGVKR